MLELGRGRGRDPTGLGHPREHRAVALAVSRRRIERIAALASMVEASTPIRRLDQAALGKALQHPGEHPLVDLERQARAAPAQPGMVGCPLAQPEPEEIPQRQAVGAAPFQAALRCRCPEIADPDACK